MKKHLIMGFGTNQSVSSVEIFLRSARALYTPEECEIALLTNATGGLEPILKATSARAFHTTSTYSPSTGRRSKALNRLFLHTLRLMDRAGILDQSPEIRKGYSALLEAWHHPQLARWFAYERVLSFHNDYDKVLLADVKDVVFQSRFFSTLVPGAVHLFEDGEDFGAEGWNGRWYREAFGSTAHNRISDRTPICIGVMAGDLSTLQALISEFSIAIARSPFGKIEQAIFNRMVIEAEFRTPLRTHSNFASTVATLAGSDAERKFTVHEGTIKDVADDRPFPIVHMYDRFPELLRQVGYAYRDIAAGSIQ